MNRLAARERFLVLYPEQERIANAHGCWNWFDRRSGKADAEAATLLAAIDLVARRHPWIRPVWRWPACRPVPAWRR